jgi:glycerol-3-phosphate dehydrogenase
LDYEQYKLVREALHERRIFLHTAPYLSAMLPIMLPIYKCVSEKPLPDKFIQTFSYQVLASALLLVWMQNVRHVGWERKYGELVFDEQR